MADYSTHSTSSTSSTASNSKKPRKDETPVLSRTVQTDSEIRIELPFHRVFDNLAYIGLLVEETWHVSSHFHEHFELCYVEEGHGWFDNSHWSDFVLRSVAVDPAIGAVGAKLMEASSMRLWHDQLLYKPGRGSGKETANVGWHQDYSYWQCAAEASLVTAWVAFDDVDLYNGCMQMIPYSHKWGLLKVSDFFEQDLQKLEDNMDLPEGASFDPEPVIMKAGQVSFHHALTIHGSGPNTTDKPRRSMAVHLMTGDTRYKAGTKGESHMNVSLLNGKDGDLFAGDLFPVVH